MFGAAFLVMDTTSRLLISERQSGFYIAISLCTVSVIERGIDNIYTYLPYLADYRHRSESDRAHRVSGFCLCLMRQAHSGMVEANDASTVSTELRLSSLLSSLAEHEIQKRSCHCWDIDCAVRRVDVTRLSRCRSTKTQPV